MHKEGRKLGKDILDVYKEKKKKKKKEWPAVLNVAEWPNHIHTEK